MEEPLESGEVVRDFTAKAIFDSSPEAIVVDAFAEEPIVEIVDEELSFIHPPRKNWDRTYPVLYAKCLGKWSRQEKPSTRNSNSQSEYWHFFQLL